MAISIVFLLISLTIVVLLAKSLSHPLESVIVNYGLPKSLVGIIIAGVILLPEGIAAVSAALNCSRLEHTGKCGITFGSSINCFGSRFYRL